MKTSFQICHIANPNSVKNSVVFSIFEAPDTYTNLNIALEPFKHQINSLCGKIIWRYVYMHMHILHNYILYVHFTCTLYITNIHTCTMYIHALSLFLRY